MERGFTQLAVKFADALATIVGEAGHHNEELFSAEASSVIVRTKIVVQAAGEFAQHLISHQMAIGIVNGLEIVKVRKQDDERRLQALALSQLLLDDLENGSAVLQSGK